MAYLQGIIERAAKLGYVVTVDHVGKRTPFLNVMTEVTERKLQTSLYVKPGDVNNTPLCSRSAQPWHVHGVWPKSMLKIAMEVEGSKKRAASKIVAKFREACIPPPEVATAALRGTDVEAAVVKKVRDSSPVQWIPLPYHPSTAKAVAKKLEQLSADPECKALYKSVFRSEMPMLRPAWQNVAEHHELSIRLACRKRKSLSVAPRMEEGDHLPTGQAQVEAPVVVAQCGTVGVFDHNTVQHGNGDRLENQDFDGRLDEHGCRHFYWGFLRPGPDFASIARQRGSTKRSKFKF